MVGVNSRTSCRQLCKELNILTIALVYILKVICYIRKHHQLVELNSNIHTYNTRRKMNSHPIIQYCLYARSVINMGIKLYKKLPGYIQGIES
jgi:hypothetical protein